MGQLMNQTGTSFQVRNGSGQLQSTGPVSGQGTLALGTVVYGNRVIVAARLDQLGQVLDGITGAGVAATPIPQGGMADPAPTRFQIGRYVNGIIHRMAIVGRPNGGAWPVEMAEVFADFTAGV